MNATNYKVQAETMMQIELEAWANGEKTWTVSNQFDESVLESAIANMDRMNDAQWAWWANSDANIMSLAHELSQFDAPEIDAVWID